MSPMLSQAGVTMFAPRLPDSAFDADFAEQILRNFESSFSAVSHLSRNLSVCPLIHSHSKRFMKLLLEEFHLLEHAPLVCKADFSEVVTPLMKDLIFETQQEINRTSSPTQSDLTQVFCESFCADASAAARYAFSNGKCPP